MTPQSKQVPIYTSGYLMENMFWNSLLAPRTDTSGMITDDIYMQIAAEFYIGGNS